MLSLNSSAGIADKNYMRNIKNGLEKQAPPTDYDITHKLFKLRFTRMVVTMYTQEMGLQSADYRCQNSSGSKRRKNEGSGFYYSG